MIPITHNEAVMQQCCKNPTISCVGGHCIAWQKYYITDGATVPVPKTGGSFPPMKPVPLSRTVYTGKGYCEWLGYN